MRVLILTYGTRGDVQPYTGLAMALIAAGHQADICTHPIHKQFIEDFGVGFVPYSGPNPQKIFDWCVRVGIFGSKFMLEVSQLAHSFMSSWGDICKENVGKYDLIVDTFTTSHHGITLAEASGVPACTIHYVPVGPTKHYYSPYAPYGMRKTAASENYFNTLSHELIEYCYGALAKRPMNRTRTDLGLEPINGFHRGAWSAKERTPVIYCHSPSYLPKAPDLSEGSRVVGYFWLPETPFTPPEDLVQFLEKGAPVYVGFGSVNVPGGKTLIVRLIQGVRAAGERVIVFTPEKNEAFLDDPDVMFVKYSVPHAWLFPRVKLAIHHGGAGTVAYALKAGIPSIIMPFFGDHFLWAHRLHEIGCGPPAMPLNSTQPEELARALRRTLDDPALLERCKRLSRQVTAEEGPTEAVRLLEHLQQYGVFPTETSAARQAAGDSEMPVVVRPNCGISNMIGFVLLALFRCIIHLLGSSLSVMVAVKQPERHYKEMVYGELPPSYPPRATASNSRMSAFGRECASFFKFPWY